MLQEHLQPNSFGGKTWEIQIDYPLFSLFIHDTNSDSFEVEFKERKMFRSRTHFKTMVDGDLESALSSSIDRLYDYAQMSQELEWSADQRDSVKAQVLSSLRNDPRHAQQDAKSGDQNKQSSNGLDVMIWRVTLNIHDISDPMYIVILDFLALDSIDTDSYAANSKAIRNPTLWVIFEDNSDLSPTALDIAREGGFTPPGWPSWFVYGYPDVLRWCSRGEGFEVVKQFNDLPEAELMEDGKLKHNILRSVINQYKSSTGKQLEAARFF